MFSMMTTIALSIVATSDSEHFAKIVSTMLSSCRSSS
jgi:hypothetical protein